MNTKILVNENKFDELFKKYGSMQNLDWMLLKAQVKQESGFDPLAENKKSHAKGLSQFMDRTWQEWEDGTPGIQKVLFGERIPDPFNPEDSIKAQAAYLRWLKNRVISFLKCEVNSLEWALAAYNYGIGYIQKAMINESRNYYLYEKKLPAETQNYVIKILGYYKDYMVSQKINKIK